MSEKQTFTPPNYDAEYVEGLNRITEENEGGCPLLPLSAEQEAEDRANRYRGPRGKLVQMNVPAIQLVSPPPENYYQVIWPLLKEFAYQTLDAHSPKSLEETIEQAEIEREAGTLTFAVVKDGTVVGGVWVNPVGDGLCLGHLVLDRHSISTAEKMKAVREAINSIFQAGFRKIQWVFFADNRAFRIFLKRLGATHEGTLKAHVNREGEWVDADMMASFPKVKNDERTT